MKKIKKMSEATAPTAPVEICDLLKPKPNRHRKKMSLRKLGTYMIPRTTKNRSLESSLFKWKKMSPNVYHRQNDGRRIRIAGAIDFHRCKLLKTLDADDPAMQAGKKVRIIRWIPATMSFIFFVKPEAKSARVFQTELGELHKSQ